MTKISYATLQKKYGGNYLLTDGWDGIVVAVHKKLGKAYKIAEKKGFLNPAVQYVQKIGTLAVWSPFLVDSSK